MSEHNRLASIHAQLRIAPGQVRHDRQDITLPRRTVIGLLDAVQAVSDQWHVFLNAEEDDLAPLEDAIDRLREFAFFDPDQPRR